MFDEDTFKSISAMFQPDDDSQAGSSSEPLEVRGTELEPPPPPTPRPGETYEEMARRIAREEKWDGDLTVAQMAQESRGKKKAKSWAGAGGLMQLMPDTARSLGVTDINDPEQNIRAGIRHMKALYAKFGDKKKALAAYNLGEHSHLLNGPDWWNKIALASNDPNIVGSPMSDPRRGAKDRTNTQNYVKNIWSNYLKGGGSGTSMNYTITDEDVKRIGKMFKGLPSPAPVIPASSSGKPLVKPGDIAPPDPQETPAQAQPGQVDISSIANMFSQKPEVAEGSETAEPPALPELTAGVPATPIADPEVTVGKPVLKPITQDDNYKNYVRSAKKYKEKPMTRKEFDADQQQNNVTADAPPAEGEIQYKVDFENVTGDKTQYGLNRFRDYLSGLGYSQEQVASLRLADRPLDPDASYVMWHLRREDLDKVGTPANDPHAGQTTEELQDEALAQQMANPTFTDEQAKQAVEATSPVDRMLSQYGIPSWITRTAVPFKGLIDTAVMSAAKGLGFNPQDASDSEVQSKLAELRHVREDDPLVIEDARNAVYKGKLLNKWLGHYGGGLAGGVFGEIGKTWNGLAGMVKLSPITNWMVKPALGDSFSNYFSKVGTGLQNIQEVSRDGDNGLVMTLGQTIAGLPVFAARMYLLKNAGLGTTTSFALDSATQPFSKNKPWSKVPGQLLDTAVAGGEGAALSLAFEGGSKFDKAIEGALNSATVTRLGDSAIDQATGKLLTSLRTDAGREAFRNNLIGKTAEIATISVGSGVITYQVTGDPKAALESAIHMGGLHLFNMAGSRVPRLLQFNKGDKVETYEVKPDSEGNVVISSVEKEPPAEVVDARVAKTETEEPAQTGWTPTHTSNGTPVQAVQLKNGKYKFVREDGTIAGTGYKNIPDTFEPYVEPENNTGPIPETQTALDAQAASATDPGQTERIAVMYAGEQAKDAPKATAKQFKIVAPNGDVILVDRAGWRAKAKELGLPTTKDGLVQYTRAGKDEAAVQDLLGRKDVVSDTSQGDAVVAQVDGKQVDAAVVTSQEAADAQAASYAEQHPNAEVSVVPTQEAAAGRIADHVTDIADAVSENKVEEPKSGTEGAHDAATSPLNDLPEPTQEQKEAGNYQKGKITINGLDIDIENPVGSVRSGTDSDGEPWFTTMNDHYGEITRTVGADKEQVDVFVKDGTPKDYNGPVFVVDQVHPETGEFDEHKVMLGFGTKQEAEAAYKANYEKDWAGMKTITEMSFPEFSDWVQDGKKVDPVVIPKKTTKAGQVADKERETDIKLLTEEIEYNQNGIESEQENIDMIKGDIPEARAARDAEIKSIRADKSLSKEAKDDAIEDAKGKYQDIKDDVEGQIEVHKEEIAQHKKDLKAAERKLKKLQPDADVPKEPATVPSSEPLKPEPTAATTSATPEPDVVRAASPEVKPTFKEDDMVDTPDGSGFVVRQEGKNIIVDIDGVEKPYLERLVTKPTDGQAGFLSLEPIREMVQIFRDAKDEIGLKVLPKLSREGLFVPAMLTASAKRGLKQKVNNLLAQAFPEFYRDKDAMAAIGRILNLDDIRGGYETFLDKHREAQAAGDDAAAQKWQARADEVVAALNAKGESIFSIDAELAAAQQNPQIVAGIEGWNREVVPYLNELYGTVTGQNAADLDTARGRVFGSRTWLLPDFKAEQMQEVVGHGGTTQGWEWRSQDIKTGQNARHAKFTGEYSTDLEAVLTNVLRSRMENAAKRNFYQALGDSGAGGLLDTHEQAMSMLIDGERPIVEPVVLYEPGTNGIPRPVTKYLAIRPDLYKEVKGVLGKNDNVKMNKALAFLTKIQVLQAVDFVAHLKNVHTVLAHAPASANAFAHAAGVLPGFGTAKALYGITKTLKQIHTDDPEIREQLDRMSQLGMIRPEHHVSKLDEILKLPKAMSQIIEAVDKASRVTMDNYFTKLADGGLFKDNNENRIRFVNQIGEYNTRVMSESMRWLKQKGFSPFIVAGRTFNMMGRRYLTGNPGAESTTYAKAARTRAINLSAGLVMSAVVPATINMLTTGMPGGRPGTPIGSIDLGQPADDDGKFLTIDVMALIGTRRGLSSTGINAVLTGLKENQTGSEMFSHAVGDIVSYGTHPWVGPAPGALFNVLTGREFTLRGGPDNPEAFRTGDGWYSPSQLLENARFALKHLNGVVYSLAAGKIGTSEEKQETYMKRFFEGMAKAPLTSVGVRSVGSPTAKLINEIFRDKGLPTTTTETDAQRVMLKEFKTRDASIGGIDPASVQAKQKLEDDIADAVKSGKLTMAQVGTLDNNSGLPKIAVAIKYLDIVPDGLRIFQRLESTEPETLKVLLPLFKAKVAAQIMTGKISEADYANLYRFGFTPESLADIDAVKNISVDKALRLRQAAEMRAVGDTTVFDQLNKKEQKAIVKEEKLTGVLTEFAGKPTEQKVFLFNNPIGNTDDEKLEYKASTMGSLKKTQEELSNKKNKDSKDLLLLSQINKAIQKYREEVSTLLPDRRLYIDQLYQKSVQAVRSTKTSSGSRSRGGH